MKKSFIPPKLYLFLGLSVLTVFSAVQLFTHALYSPEGTKPTSAPCPVDCKCDDYGKVIECYESTSDSCPVDCKCDDYGKVIECYESTSDTCPENCSCDEKGNLIECYKESASTCPADCKCDNYGKVIECYKDTENDTVYECPYGCECDKYGKVLECDKGQSDEVPGSCYDTDNGPDAFEYGQAYISGKNGEKLENLYDKCYSNAELAEAFCDAKGPNYDFQKCPNGCDKGVCFKKELGCKDTDGGKNYFKKGDVIFEDTSIGNKGMKSDICQDDKHLSEYVCEDGQYQGDRFVFCPEGCKDGACLGNATGSTETESTTPGEKKLLPPAGYEDEVMTNPTGYDNPFPDTDMNSLEGQSAAELYRRGIIGGFPDGEFKSDRLVNRAETAKFLLLARFGTVEEMKNNGQFPDVMDGQWYTKYVLTAANLGIIKGYPDGTFMPANNVNTAEFLKMISLTFDLDLNMPHWYTDVVSGDWFQQYAGVAYKYNLFPDRKDKLEPGRSLTRSEVAVAIYSYLKNK